MLPGLEHSLAQNSPHLESTPQMFGALNTRSVECCSPAIKKHGLNCIGTFDAFMVGISRVLSLD